jgi:aspartate 1-decarboxylase
MQIHVVKSKIHRVTVTGADLNYIGSITIDEALMDAANLVEGEKVSIVNVNNGERLETYVIKGNRNSGEITLNGPAARRVQKGDIIIVIAYGILDID